jgi:hypothetical protein
VRIDEPANLVAVADQVRPGLEQSSAAYSPELLRQLRELYVEPAVLDEQLAEDLGQARGAQRALETPRDRSPYPLSSLLLRRALYPELPLADAAEALGATAGVTAQALELGVDGDDLAIQNDTVIDGASFDAQFPATLCQVHERSRNRPSAEYCAGR